MHAKVPARLWVAALCAVVLTACSSLPPLNTAPREVTVYVVKRSWHTDLGFEVEALQPPLAALREPLPAARYLLFGFGDEHYLMSHGRRFGRLLGAVWPGAGLVLMTGLEGTPEQAFGADDVVRLRISSAQARALQQFIWQTLAQPAAVLAPGPYDDSVYLSSVQRYSGLHTCNTWTAQGLRAAGLPVRSFGVEFSGQVWKQVRRIRQSQNDDAPIPAR